jgi:hypothetical protein
VFCYTSWHFYVFSRTNLLTRCHSSSSLFMLFLCFRKATQKKFSELDETKAEVTIFSRAWRSPKQRWRRARGRPDHPTVRATPWPRRGLVWAPGPLSDTALPPIYSPRPKNLKTRSIFHETYCKPPPSSTQDREGPEALPDTLPQRGITARGLLHHHACLRSDVWVVYLRLRVHSSS